MHQKAHTRKGPQMIKVTAQDFEHLTTNSMKWGEDWIPQIGRFENLCSPELGTDVWFIWDYAHWTNSYAGAVLCRTFLNSIDENYEIAFDTATQDYVILTNYAGCFASVK